MAAAEVLPLAQPLFAVPLSRSSCVGVDEGSALAGAADRPTYGDVMVGWLLSPSVPLGVCAGVFWWASASQPDGVDGCMLGTEAG